MMPDRRRFNTNPANYWHVVLNDKIPRGSKVRTVRFGNNILARMDYWTANGERNWQIRSLLFSKGKFTAKSAVIWATKHSYEWIKVEG